MVAGFSVLLERSDQRESSMVLCRLIAGEDRYGLPEDRKGREEREGRRGESAKGYREFESLCTPFGRSLQTVFNIMLYRRRYRSAMNAVKMESEQNKNMSIAFDRSIQDFFHQSHSLTFFFSNHTFFVLSLLSLSLPL